MIAHSRQVAIASLIRVHSLGVTTAVALNDKSRRACGKIDDVAPDHNLPPKLHA